MNNNNNISDMLKALNTMDKNQLQNGINQLNKILNDEDKQKILNLLKNK